MKESNQDNQTKEKLLITINHKVSKLNDELKIETYLLFKEHPFSPYIELTALVDDNVLQVSAKGSNLINAYKTAESALRKKLKKYNNFKFLKNNFPAHLFRKQVA